MGARAGVLAGLLWTELQESDSELARHRGLGGADPSWSGPDAVLLV